MPCLFQPPSLPSEATRSYQQVERVVSYSRVFLFATDASPARALLTEWAKDSDGGELGALLQRYGVGPPGRALLATLGSRADSAAQDLVVMALAGVWVDASHVHAVHSTSMASLHLCDQLLV